MIGCELAHLSPPLGLGEKLYVAWVERPHKFYCERMEIVDVLSEEGMDFFPHLRAYKLRNNNHEFWIRVEVNICKLKCADELEDADEMDELDRIALGAAKTMNGLRWHIVMTMMMTGHDLDLAVDLAAHKYTTGPDHFYEMFRGLQVGELENRVNSIFFGGLELSRSELLDMLDDGNEF